MTRLRKALILGVTGQDGRLLVNLLSNKNYEIVGTSRSTIKPSGLWGAGSPSFRIVQLDPQDAFKLKSVIEKFLPDEIYVLCGQSSVANSFLNPLETLQSHFLASYNVFQSVISLCYVPKIFVATSGDMFGNVSNMNASENTALNPKSPYGLAKVSVFNLVKYFRSNHGLNIWNGILFNHESVLRPTYFVTSKIIIGAISASRDSTFNLELGNIGISRDWGFATEYVEAMWRMLQTDVPEDFIVGTGTTHSLEDFIRLSFESEGLDYRDHISTTEALKRPSDIEVNGCNPRKIFSKIGWRAKVKLPELVDRLIFDFKHVKHEP